MKILLTAINAKYIHTCPAVYSLRAYALACGRRVPDIQIAEYTINDRYQDVLSGIMDAGADIIAFSVYIWNTIPVRRLIRDIRRIRGNGVRIWAGGPEASYAPEEFLRESGADLVMLGEGEVTFTALAERVMRLPSCSPCQEALYGNIPGNTSVETERMLSTASAPTADLSSIPGIAFMEPERMLSAASAPTADLSSIPGIAFMEHGRLVSTGFAPPVDLSSLPFLYGDLASFEHRILYYESSRGCPFSCAYCLSGNERGVRYRDLDLVLKELDFFLEHRVKQVKFVDRTFNASPERALTIWRFIQEHDNGVTNFHFEIEADRMTQEELDLLSSFRPGLIQMEIGVQSANPLTLRSVHRNTDLSAVKRLMAGLTPIQNINLHLDLIAGLPWEDLASFRHSFNEVYAMRPHQFQLGFLKLLPGTELHNLQEKYGLICSDTAPYEVLRTKWLSFEELSLLHRISDRVEEFVNSQGFRRSLPLAEKLFPDAFSLFQALAEYYHDEGFESGRPSVQQRYALFSDFVTRAMAAHPELSAREKAILMDTICLDQALHVHPSRRMQAVVRLDVGDGMQEYRIDYTRCSPVNGEAAVTKRDNYSGG